MTEQNEKPEGNEAEEFMIKMVIKIVGFVLVTGAVTVGAAMYLI